MLSLTMAESLWDELSGSDSMKNHDLQELAIGNYEKTWPFLRTYPKV